MADKKEKIFAGGGKKKSDTWLQVTLKPSVLNKYIQEFNGNEFIKLNINIKASPNEYGKDVEVTIDTWQPPAKEATQTTNPIELSTDEVFDKYSHLRISGANPVKKSIIPEESESGGLPF